VGEHWGHLDGGGSVTPQGSLVPSTSIKNLSRPIREIPGNNGDMFSVFEMGGVESLWAYMVWVERVRVSFVGKTLL